MIKRLYLCWYRWWIKDSSFKKSPTPEMPQLPHRKVTVPMSPRRLKQDEIHELEIKAAREIN